MSRDQAFQTRAERAAAGRALRKDVPRHAIGDWRPAATRRDPLAILEAQAAARVPRLVPIRYGRMQASPFAFFRGAAAVMAADLGDTPSPGIHAQLCGDAHVSNFGLFAAPDRRTLFDVNDFDETIYGPFEWDLLRLAASVAIAAGDAGCSRAEGEHAVLRAVTRYRERIHELSALARLDVWYSRVEYEALLERVAAMSRQARALAAHAFARAQRRTTAQAVSKLSVEHGGERRIIADPPLITPLPRDDIDAMAGVFAGFLDSFGDAVRRLAACFRVVDVAEKVVGVGSVGLRALVVLLQDGDGEPILMQLKQAVPSVLAPYAHAAHAPAPAHHGKRVVEGQRAIQGYADPFLGWSRGVVQGAEVDLYCRQLRDHKSAVDATTLRPQTIGDYAQLCGAVLARAHARSGDPAKISGYLGGPAHTDHFDRAIAQFAATYARLNRADHAALVDAIHAGRIEAIDA